MTPLVLNYAAHMLRYAELSMYTIIIQFVSFCCHGNGKIAYSAHEVFLFFFLNAVFSYLVGSSEQSETHKELSWDAR